jgi:ketosteroid isomerase-like protein
MSADSVGFVRGIYQAFGEGRIGDVVGACADDVRWEVVGDPGVAPHYGVFEGHAGVTEFFTRLGGYNEFSEFTPQSFLDAGDDVVVTGRAVGRLRENGAVVVDRWIHVFNVRDGRLAAFTEWDNSAAHAAARRRETVATA